MESDALQQQLQATQQQQQQLQATQTHQTVASALVSALGLSAAVHGDDLERLGGEYALAAHARKVGFDVHADVLVDLVVASVPTARAALQLASSSVHAAGGVDVDALVGSLRLAAVAELLNCVRGRRRVMRGEEGGIVSGTQRAEEGEVVCDSDAVGFCAAVSRRTDLLFAACFLGSCGTYEEALRGPASRLSGMLACLLGVVIANSSPPLWLNHARWLSQALCDGHTPELTALVQEFFGSVLDCTDPLIVRIRAVAVVQELLRELAVHAGSEKRLAHSGYYAAEASTSVQLLLGIPLGSALIRIKADLVDALGASAGPSADAGFEIVVETLRRSCSAVKSIISHGVVPFPSAPSANYGLQVAGEEEEASIWDQEIAVHGQFTVSASSIISKLLEDTPSEIHKMLGYINALVSDSRENRHHASVSVLLEIARLLIATSLRISETHCVVFARCVGPILDVLLQVTESMGGPAGSDPFGATTNDFGELWCFESFSAPGSLVDAARPWDRLCAEAISGLHKIVTNAAFRCDDVAKRQVPDLVAAYDAIHARFTETSVPLLTRILVTLYFPTRADDFDRWMADPELYVEEEIRCAWEQNARDAAIILLAHLEGCFEEWCAPELVRFAESLPNRTDLVELEAILLALGGEGAYVTVSDRIRCDLLFDQILSWGETVGNPANAQSRQTLALGQRLAQFVEGWGEAVNLLPEPEVRLPRVFQMLIRFISSHDYVVAVWGAVALRACLRDAQFDPMAFAPFVMDACAKLVELLQRCSETSTNIEVLRVLAIIVKRMRVEFANFTETFELLWQLHESCDVKQQRMFLGGIIEIVSTLVRVVDASIWRPFLLAFITPLIREACDRHGVSKGGSRSAVENSMVLMEDGYSLWLGVLRRHESPGTTESMGLPVRNLFQLIPLAIEYRSDDPSSWSIDHESLVLAITQQYVLQCDESFLRERVDDVRAIVLSCTSRFSELGEAGKTSACMLLGYWIQLFPSEIPSLFDAFSRLLWYLVDVSQFGKDDTDESIPVVAAHIVTVFARVMLVNVEFMTAFLEASAQSDEGQTFLGQVAFSGLIRSPSITGAFVNAMFSHTRKMAGGGGGETARICARGVAMLFLIVDAAVWTRAPMLVECVLAIDQSLADGRRSGQRFVDEDGKAPDEELLQLFDQITLTESNGAAANTTGAAHDLSSPLTTLKAVLDELIERTDEASSLLPAIFDTAADEVGAQFAVQVLPLLPPHVVSRINA